MKIAALASPHDGAHRVQLVEGSKAIGAAAWHLTSLDDGVVQILDLSVEPAYQRQGQGGRLLEMLIAEARDFLRSRRGNLRRIWIAVEQKEQVIGRAFLTSHGFHHVGTVKNLLRDQDQMIYALALD